MATRPTRIAVLYFAHETVSFLRSTRPGPGEAEGIAEWRISHDIEPDVYSLGDFDFTRPKAGLLVSRRAALACPGYKRAITANRNRPPTYSAGARVFRSSFCHCGGCWSAQAASRPS